MRSKCPAQVFRRGSLKSSFIRRVRVSMSCDSRSASSAASALVGEVGNGEAIGKVGGVVVGARLRSAVAAEAACAFSSLHSPFLFSSASPSSSAVRAVARFDSDDSRRSGLRLSLCTMSSLSVASRLRPFRSAGPLGPGCGYAHRAAEIVQALVVLSVAVPYKCRPSRVRSRSPCPQRRTGPASQPKSGAYRSPRPTITTRSKCLHKVLQSCSYLTLHRRAFKQQSFRRNWLV